MKFFILTSGIGCGKVLMVYGYISIFSAMFSKEENFRDLLFAYKEMKSKNN